MSQLFPSIAIHYSLVLRILLCSSAQMNSIEGGTLESQAQLTRVEAGLRATQLRQLVEESVARSAADGILLSGGLDTSIVAAVAAQQGHKLRAFCVSVAGVNSPDESFARKMAEQCGFEIQILRPSLDDLVAMMPEVMRVLGTFDPMEL